MSVLPFAVHAADRPNASAPVACLYSGKSVFQPSAMVCIRKESFNRDLCSAIEYFARANNLPSEYFARLLWRESRFQPGALSPKGAQGIAQFMPGTAKLRGLQDRLNVLTSLQASAVYLDELKNRFGNLGLAAIAYNAGEGGLATYLSSGALPFETRSYVLAITSHSAEEWKSEDPPSVAAVSLEKDKPFQEACLNLSNKRKLLETVTISQANWAPWGAQLAANANPNVAQRLFVNIVSKLPSPLNAELPVVLRQRDKSFGFRPRYAMRLGRQTRADAEKVCAQIRLQGEACLVFKN